MKRIISVLLSLSFLLSCSITAFAKDTNVINISKDAVSHDVNDKLYGISMEDISNACDGGLVSNLVNNGSFEYYQDACPGWDLSGAVSVSINSGMNENNPSYAVIHCNDGGVTIRNTGFSDEMSFQKGVKYTFSCYVRNDSFEGSIGIYLDSKKNSNNIIQISNGDVSSSKWTELHATIKSTVTEQGTLAIVFDGTGEIMLDMVSLVPQNSYGYDSEEWKYTSLRQDAVDGIKALKPAFIRFPGGCLVEGASLEDMYSWKDTIGPLDARRQHKSVYDDVENGAPQNNTSAMGYHEYFQLCEDMGAIAVPVVGAGIACQRLNDYDAHMDAYNKLNMSDDQWSAYLVNERGYNERDKAGIKEYTEFVDSLGINNEDDYNAYINRIALKPESNEFTNYIQDVIDLIEYANGDAITTYWGALRAMNGHERPFNIQYLAVGNENYGDVYDRNFDALAQKIKEKYPDVTLIRSTKTSFDSVQQASGDYVLDEHYVADSNSLIASNNAFDGIDRDSKGIMIGAYSGTEYNMGAATSEACLLTSAERNGDIVSMVAYSPAVVKADEGAMIMLSDMDIAYSPSYYSQMIFANNIGKKIVDTNIVDDTVFQSVTVDENSQVIYAKLVNTSKSSKSIVLDFGSFGVANRVSIQSVSHKFADAKNIIGKQVIAIEEDDLDSSNGSVEVTIGANSVNVVRIAYGENDGTALWQVPDTVDVSTKAYIPSSVKVLIAVVVIGFALGSAIGYFAYTKIIKKKGKNDDV